MGRIEQRQANKTQTRASCNRLGDNFRDYTDLVRDEDPYAPPQGAWSRSVTHPLDTQPEQQIADYQAVI